MDAWYQQQDGPPPSDGSLSGRVFVILAIAIAVVLGFVIAGASDRDGYHSDMPPGVNGR